MKTFLKIFGLSLIWFSVWAILIFYLEPQGIDYLNRYILTSIYFLIIIVVLTYVFKKETDEYVDRFSLKDLFFMMLFSVAVILIYYFVNILAEGGSLSSIKNSLPAVFQLDDRFLVTKAFDIMFQQTFFMISVYYLFNNNVSKKIDMFLFGFYVMLIHLPILFVSSPAGKIFFGVSFFYGMIFAYFVTKSKKGFMYSFMVQFGFYVVLATIFWLGGAHFLMKLI